MIASARPSPHVDSVSPTNPAIEPSDDVREHTPRVVRQSVLQLRAARRTPQAASHGQHERTTHPDAVEAPDRPEDQASDERRHGTMTGSSK